MLCTSVAFIPLCLRMLGNVSEAEDMTSGGVHCLFRKIGSFRGESAFLHLAPPPDGESRSHAPSQEDSSWSPSRETINPSEEGLPKRDFGSRDTQLAGSVDRCRSRTRRHFPASRLPDWSSCSTMWKVLSIMKSPLCWSAQPETANLSSIKRASNSASCFANRIKPSWPM